jgi:hypothetical protein
MPVHSTYESDDEKFNAPAYKLKGDKYAIAWRIYGWQTEPDEDTEWSGIYNRTGMVIAVMVGDDRKHVYDPDDFEPINEEDYCSGCGQIGCGWGH